MPRQKPQPVRIATDDPKQAVLALLIRELGLIPIPAAQETGGAHGTPVALEVPRRAVLL